MGRSWAFLGRFRARLRSKLRFEAIFFDFSSILGGFGEDFGSFFSMIFRFFAKIVILQKSLFFLRKIAIFKDSSSFKSIKNLSKIDANFAHEKKESTKAKKKDWGRSWAPFGRGLGRSRASCGRSWGLFGRSWGVLGGLLRRSCALLAPR